MLPPRQSMGTPSKRCLLALSSQRRKAWELRSPGSVQYHTFLSSFPWNQVYWGHSNYWLSRDLFWHLGERGTGSTVTVGRTVEELDVEEGVVSTGHPMLVRRQHDAPDGVAARTHDHHWGGRNKEHVWNALSHRTARTRKPGEGDVWQGTGD